MGKEYIRRSFLYVPGSSEKMISKAINSMADSIILDLEDSVSLLEKEKARDNVIQAVQLIKARGKEAVVRVNSINSINGIQDIIEVSAACPDAFVIPKADEKSMIVADALLGAAEEKLGLARTTMKLIPLVETSSGIINIGSVLRSASRINAVMLGAEDLTKELGVERTREGKEIQHARSVLVYTGCAFGIDIIDTPFTGIKDLEGLKTETEAVKNIGFTGKSCIHPSHIEIINSIFTPEKTAVEYSKRLLDTFEAAVREGKGACSFEGKMIDAPVAEKAKKIVEKARLIN